MFESFLKQHTTAEWTKAREALLPSIHEVDRNATTIWFHFFPLNLAQAVSSAGDAAALERELRIDGTYRLADQIDTSHPFFYGHRYWPQVKAAILARADSATASPSVELTAIVRDLAKQAAAAAKVEESLLVGITAVGLMTLQQVGLAAFRAGSSGVGIASQPTGRTPAQLLADRKKDDGQGIAGIWRGIRSRYTVTFDENRREGHFPLVNEQQLTTASALDTRDYSSSGPRRCHEGPIPVECRTASCGTCWVGVIAGAEKLSAVDTHERRRLKEFGYLDSADTHPVIRLSCMAVASGNITIVIPPWNGFIGKKGLGVDPSTGAE